MKEVSSVILRLYFSVIAAVTFFTLMYGAVDLLNMGLKTYVFQAADAPVWLENCSAGESIEVIDKDIDEEAFIARCGLRNQETIHNYHRTKASDAVQNLALILVALPLFIMHFRIVYKDWKQLSNNKK